ncbi:MAG: TolC family protein [Elusimicrobiota bacterium]|jgi:outer membrane protein|nr:TolC family protein [Elusimicrobiota bacterium]
MKKAYQIVILSFIVLAAFSSISQAVVFETVDWDSIIRQAQEQNPSIIEAKISLDNAEIAYRRAIGELFPEIGLSAGLSQSGSDEREASKSLSYGISASLNIFNGFSNYYLIKQRNADLQSAKAKYNRAISDAAFDLANAYINLMWAYETVSLLETIRDRRSENKEMLNLKYNSGNVDLGSLKRVIADVETAQLDLRKAQRYIETASIALLSILGRNEINVILQTQERLPMNGRQIKKPNFAQVVENIPEYIIAKYSVESAKSQLNRTESSWYPSINMSAGISRSNDEWQLSSYNESWNAGISLNYSLFSGGKNILDIDSAKNNLKTAQNNFRAINYSLISKAVAAFNNLLDAYETISVRSSYLEASKTQAEISERKYVNGLSSYQDWYSIENDFINSQSKLLEARKSAAVIESQWRNFTGHGFFKLNYTE